jgi:hypothetical protein
VLANRRLSPIADARGLHGPPPAGGGNDRMYTKVLGDVEDTATGRHPGPSVPGVLPVSWRDQQIFYTRTPHGFETSTKRGVLQKVRIAKEDLYNSIN